LSRRNDQAVRFQAGHVDRHGLEVATPERCHGAFACGHLDRQVAALPGNQDATRLQQREAELDQLAKARDRPRGDGRPTAPVAMIAGKGLRSDRGRFHGVGETGRAGRSGKEA
jgi:hypothetical protein